MAVEIMPDLDRLPLLLAACLFTACGVDDATLTTADDDAMLTEAELAADQLPATFRRVALARVYQHQMWTLPAADAYRPNLYPSLTQRRIAYVCDQLEKLRPTFVSGLVRIDDSELLSAEQVQIYRGVRSCLRQRLPHPVRFDFVLNALHYTDGAASREEGAGRLKARLDYVISQLGPEMIFFDFFSVPFNVNHPQHRNWHPAVIQAGIAWLRDHRRLVGGNVWGVQVPPGSDFVALDNFDRAPNDPAVDGFDYISKQASGIHARHPKLPILMHLENNPQKWPSEGLKWIGGTRAYREQVLELHARHQDDVGYWYMYPAFFPLKITGPSSREAYDVAADGDMIGRMKTLMTNHTYRP